MKLHVFNSTRAADRARKRLGDGLFLIVNEDVKEPAEIRIYQSIGEDPWTGGGFTAQDFSDALKQVPRNRDLNIRINSPGGDVWDGFTIKTLLDEWPGKVTTHIDGVAASTASWMALGSDEIRMASHAQMFIHDAWGFVMGNAGDMTEAAAKLNKTSDQIAGIYAARNGKPAREMRRVMKDNTLLTGAEAKALGLVDTLTDDAPLQNFTPGWLDSAKTKLAVLNTTQTHEVGRSVPAEPSSTQTPLMNKDKMIALLNKWGVTIPANATDEQLEALISAGKPNPNPANASPPSSSGTAAQGQAGSDSVITLTRADFQALNQKIDGLTEANNSAKTLRITSAVDALVSNDQLTPAEREAALARALKDETYLNELQKRPVVRPGAEPVSASSAELTSDDPQTLVKHFGKFQDSTIAWQRGQDVPMNAIAQAAVNKAHFFARHRNKILQFLNANTIPAGLKRSAILQEVIYDFARRLININAFATKFENVPMLGTNKVQVLFYDLDTVASIPWDPDVGYSTSSATAVDTREITVGTGATDGNRLRVDVGFTSEEFARQPLLKIKELVGLKVDKLASDVITDVLGIVTAANFPTVAATEAAAGFDSSDVANLVLAAKLWPLAGRSLMVDTAYHVNLLKDPAFLGAHASASDLAIKEGRLFPRVMGFNYMENPTIPANGENLVGFINHQSAILFATAPVPPVEEVRNAGVTYEVVTHPESGLTFEYRTFGAAILDKAVHSIELSYGFAKGNANALQRIRSGA